MSASSISPVAGVGAVVFHDEKVLLVKRKNPPYANQWAIPGGKIKPGETLQQAAEREILEETGITIKAGDTVYAFDVIEHNDNGNLSMHYVVIDLEAEYVSGNPSPQDDALEANWWGKDELYSLNINDNTVKLLKEKYSFSC